MNLQNFVFKNRFCGIFARKGNGVCSFLDLSSEGLVGNSIEDYIKAMNLSIERGIDITDALFSCYRNKDENAVVLTKDKNFEIVKDLAKIKII